MMSDKDIELYVESTTPLNQHEYQGWFYYYPTKKFYRWNDIPYKIKEKENGTS